MLCFESDRWYRRRLLLLPTAALLLVCAYGLQDSGIGADIKVAIPLYTVGLFFFCMFLHGELAQMRPGPRYLTRFYLMLSLGGALGGISVGLIAPRVLPAYYELGIGFVITALLAMALLRTSKRLDGGNRSLGNSVRVVPLRADRGRLRRRTPHHAELLWQPAEPRYRSREPAG